MFGSPFLARLYANGVARRPRHEKTRAPCGRLLILEPLEGRCLLNIGDMLYPLLSPNPRAYAEFGSVAADGDLIVVGEPLADVGALYHVGRAYVFDSRTGALLRTFENPRPESAKVFGAAVGVSGSAVVVGAPGYYPGDVNPASVYVFDALTGALVRTIDSPSGPGNDRFGSSVAVSGPTVLVGAPQDSTGAPYAGSAYIFDLGTGNLVSALHNPAPSIDDNFGRSVAASATTIAVGAPGRTDRDSLDPTVPGCVYLYDTASATLRSSVSSPTPRVFDWFGFSLALSGSTLAVGSPGDDTGARNTGSAYIFNADTGNLLWAINDPSPKLNDHFGHSVAVSGSTVLVGLANPDSRVTYVFDGASATLLCTLNDPPPATYNDGFGLSVAVSSGLAVVGAPGKDGAAIDAGAAYVFDVRNDPSFTGTPGDDTFAFSTDGTYHHVSVTLAGQPTQNYTYLASDPVTFTFNGNGGNDKITLDGGPQNETVVTHPTSVTFSGPTGTYQVVGNDIDDIRVTAGAGTGQTATMYDAAGTTDTFTSHPTYAEMSGAGYYDKVTGFGPVNAYASGDPADTAKFYDSPAADTFSARPAFPALGLQSLAQMACPGYATSVAHGFSKQYGYGSFVYGQPGQGDRANLYDGPGNDTWIGYGKLNYSEMTGTGYYTRAQGFDLQYGYVTGGGTDNVARFYDTPGDDIFNAKGDYSYLAGQGMWWFASGFQRVYAQKTSGGGYDRAYFSHTSGNYKAIYNVRSYQGYMADTTGTFFNLASDFNEYVGYATVRNNHDEAYFRTTGGDDTFLANPSEADLTGVEPETGKPVHLYATGFEKYVAWKPADVGGFVQATLNGTSGDDTFSAWHGYCEMTLSDGVKYEVSNFDTVLTLAAGGNDTATLTGAATGTNTFWGHLTDAVLSDGTLDPTTGDLTTPRSPFGYYFKLSGFDALADGVTAIGPAGATNQRKIIPAIDYSLAFTGTWLDAP